PETFKTKALAESRLAELRTYARKGVPFDVATGLPVPEARQARVQAARAGELSWYQHALNYLARRRKGLAGPPSVARPPPPQPADSPDAPMPCGPPACPGG